MTRILARVGATCRAGRDGFDYGAPGPFLGSGYYSDGSKTRRRGGARGGATEASLPSHARLLATTPVGFWRLSSSSDPPVSSSRPNLLSTLLTPAQFMTLLAISRRGFGVPLALSPCRATGSGPCTAPRTSCRTAALPTPRGHRPRPRICGGVSGTSRNRSHPPALASPTAQHRQGHLMASSSC